MLDQDDQSIAQSEHQIHALTINDSIATARGNLTIVGAPAANTESLKTVVNSHMHDYQVRLFYEMEAQINDKTHPAQLLAQTCFKTAFLKHYEQYVDKKTPQTTNIDLLNKIIAKTVGLQSDYVFKMAENFHDVE